MLRLLLELEPIDDPMLRLLLEPVLIDEPTLRLLLVLLELVVLLLELLVEVAVLRVVELDEVLEPEFVVDVLRFTVGVLVAGVLVVLELLVLLGRL